MQSRLNMIAYGAFEKRCFLTIFILFSKTFFLVKDIFSTRVIAEDWCEEAYILDN